MERENLQGQDIPQGTSEVEIVRVRDSERNNEKDLVVTETPLTVFLNNKEFVTLLCSPEKLDFLAVGFLRSEGLIQGSSDLRDLHVDHQKGIVYVRTADQSDLTEKLYGKRTITSGCGKGTIFFNVLDSLQSRPVESNLKIEAGRLLKLMSELQNDSILFKTTGGVHSAALADRDKILFSSEDIGRHNAVDKIAGECLLKNISLDDKILLSSGRLSSEIVIKGAKLRLPFIVSRSAPTSLGVELAEKLGVTLVGFARGRRLNIYSHADRII
ncbi:MAG: formate dehydrogenase accessory sulfurtransferase FdhD [Bacillota bacterium]|nr:formate dehydrogenase accessory sulfurtransferase FdhD [Bacillota bacterium]